MADFVKKTWACDDTITADELNRMENGIESANSGGGTEPLVVTLTSTPDPEGGEDIYSVDKTFAEISNAVANGVDVYVVGQYGSRYSLVAIDEYGASFTHPYVDETDMSMSGLYIDSDNSVSHYDQGVEFPIRIPYQVRFNEYNGVWTCEDTYADLLDKFDRDQMLQAVAFSSGGTQIYHLSNYSNASNTLYWTSEFVYDGAVVVSQLSLNNNNVAGYDEVRK